MGEFVKVAQIGELEPSAMRHVEIGGRRIAIAKVNGSCYAIDAECTHRGCSLDEGTLEGTVVTCPCHAGQFDIRTGEVLAPPPRLNVRSYAVKVEGGDVLVESPE